MNKIELEILKIGFEAGKKAIEMHPDDDEYDTIRFEEAQEQVKNLNISLVSQQRELLLDFLKWKHPNTFYQIKEYHKKDIKKYLESK